MSRRRLLRLLTPSVVVSDGFFAADTTAITALDLPWTKHASGSNNTAAPAVATNRAHNENAVSASVYYRDDWQPASADYDVEARIYVASDNNSSNAGPAGRIVTGANTYYHLRYAAAVDAWQLVKVVAGSLTQLGSNGGTTITVGTSAVGRLSMRGSLIQAWVDGVVIVSVIDTAIIAPGRAGIRWQNNATSAVGVHVDSWAVTQ